MARSVQRRCCGDSGRAAGAVPPRRFRPSYPRTDTPEPRSWARLRDRAANDGGYLIRIGGPGRDFTRQIHEPQHDLTCGCARKRAMTCERERGVAPSDVQRLEVGTE